MVSQHLPYFCFPEMSSPRTENSTGRGACRWGGQTGPAGTAAVHQPQAQQLCSINHCEVYIWYSSSLVVSNGNSFIMVTVQVAKSGLVLPILRLRPRGSERGGWGPGAVRSRTQLSPLRSLPSPPQRPPFPVTLAPDTVDALILEQAVCAQGRPSPEC